MVLLVPTVVWVRLRLPRLRRFVEFVCLLPLLTPGTAVRVSVQPTPVALAD